MDAGLESGGESLLPHIPYPDGLYPEQAIRNDLITRILESQSPVLVGEAKITPIDLHRTPHGQSDQEILDTVSLQLNAAFGALDEQPRSAQEKAQYEATLDDLNEALLQARGYLRRVLGLRVPGAKVGSKEDIVSLMRKTSRYGVRNRQGLEMHAGYCALVSTALAAFELKKRDAHLLEAEMKSVEGFLSEPEEDNNFTPLFRRHVGVDTATMYGVHPTCRVRLSMRDKEPDSQITKYLSRPESSAESALKDAIGIRIEVENERIEDVLVGVLTYFQAHLDASDLKIEDRNILDEKGEERTDLFTIRKSQDVPNGYRIAVTADKNPMSSENFRAVRILGNIKIPRKERVRSFEVQVVERDNKNEKKLSSYVIYELKKKITVMSRLFGGCSEKWLKTQLRKISDTEGYPDKIIKGLLKNGEERFLTQLPQAKRVYGAVSVYDRWIKTRGFIEDPAVRKNIVHGLGLKQDPLANPTRPKLVSEAVDKKA